MMYVKFNAQLPGMNLDWIFNLPNLFVDVIIVLLALIIF